ncbi:hypothetical protein BSLG_001773 [Batrachochytrium salamandrivorans]|nr:hypothetical protein BSLG_001773 [Batrachochytrium salamandrivorans]
MTLTTEAAVAVADPSRNFHYSVSFILLAIICVCVSYFSQSWMAPTSIDITSHISQPVSFIANPVRRIASAVRLLATGTWSLSVSSRSTTSHSFTNTSHLGLTTVSDWLQGPYIYALYKSYNYDLDNIALLLLPASYHRLLSGHLGRKLGCILFCILYALSCITKLYPDFSMLMLGRLLGGISTSLLFSVFESWMVSEHRSRGFDDSLLSETFAWSTFVNGLVAIISGVIANYSVDVWGLVSPFMIAVVFLMVAMVVIQLTWTENYGSKSSSSPSPSFISVINTVFNSPSILAVGAMQFGFESAMYTFVFLWSPVLEKYAGPTVKLPFGVIFSSFMVCIMIGSIVFKILMQKNLSHELIAKAVFASASIILLLPAVTNSEAITYMAFNVFEACCGLYFPSMGSIRSKVVPEDTRSTVMNIFRVPLNLMVVFILLKVDSISHTMLFIICSMLIGCSFWFSKVLADSTDGASDKQQYKIVSDDVNVMVDVSRGELSQSI